MLSFRISTMVKDALDNLPSGVCYFNEKGVPILVNRTMHKLAYALTKRDLQNINDLDAILSSPDEVMPGDGTVWRFRSRRLGGNERYTEIIAADATEIYRRKRELERNNAQQREIMQRLEEISRNVVSIARSEEILAMKMRIHNDLGYALSAARRFIAADCPDDEKLTLIAGQRAMAKQLMGEIGNDDETDIFEELKASAEKLGMSVRFTGELRCEETITKAARECLINTVRHANGDTVYINAAINDNGIYEVVITNNGKPPVAVITEGGGLSSLRKSIEESGGVMRVQSVPRFALSIELPVSGSTAVGGGAE